MLTCNKLSGVIFRVISRVNKSTVRLTSHFPREISSTNAKGCGVYLFRVAHGIPHPLTPQPFLLLHGLVR